MTSEKTFTKNNFYFIITMLFLAGAWNWIQLFEIKHLEAEVEYLIDNQRTLYNVTLNNLKSIKNLNEINSLILDKKDEQIKCLVKEYYPGLDHNEDQSLYLANEYFTENCVYGGKENDN